MNHGKKKIAILSALLAWALLCFPLPVKAEGGLKLIQTRIVLGVDETYVLQADGIATADLSSTSSNQDVAYAKGGTIYAYQPGFAKITISSRSDSSLSAVLEVVVRPGQVTKVTQEKAGPDRIGLSWKKKPFADGYRIYYRKKGEETYVLAKETGQTKAVLKNLAAETMYQVCIVATIDTPTGKQEGIRSQALTVYTAPKAPKAVKGLKVIKGKYSYYRGKKIRYFTLRWKKAAGATSYEVYAQNGNRYDKIDTVKKPEAKLYAGVGYGYRLYVVACRTKNKVTSQSKKSKKIVVRMI